MAKFKNSSEAIDSTLVLWPGVKHTNTSVSEIYDIFVRPLNPIEQGPGQTIQFDVPQQQTGFLLDVEYVATFRVRKENEVLPATEQVSIVNNIAAALFSMVEVRVNERMNLLQQMRQSYNLCNYFETVLNNSIEREEILATRELFIMDVGSSKEEADESKYIIDEHHHVTAASIKNTGAAERARKIALSAKCTVSSKINVPFLKQHKAILPNTSLLLTFTLNDPEYMIMASTDEYQLIVDDMYLKCTYVKPHPILHSLITEKLKTNPVIYECDKQVLAARLLPAGSQHYTIDNMFEQVLPKFLLLALQDPESMNGKINKNNFTFYSISSCQLYINNRQYFAKPLTNDPREMLDQIYKSVGKDGTGSCLLKRNNLAINQFYTFTLTDDRIFGKHYGLKKIADTRIEIDVGTVTASNLVLLAYCLHDIQIIYDSAGNISVVE